MLTITKTVTDAVPIIGTVKIGRPFGSRLSTGAGILLAEFLFKVTYNLCNLHPVLLHTIPIPHRHGFVFQALKINRQAIRRADLVLPAVTPANALRSVVFDDETLP